MTLITGLGIVNKLQSPIQFFENVLITSVTWRSGVGEGGLQFIIMYYIYKYKFVRYKNNHNRAQKSLVWNQAHSPRLHCFPNQVAKVQLFVEEWQALVFVILCYEVHCVLMWIPQLNRRCWRAKRLDSVYWDDQEDTAPVQCNTISSSVIAPRKNATNVYTSCKYIYMNIWSCHKTHHQHAFMNLVRAEIHVIRQVQHMSDAGANSELLVVLQVPLPWATHRSSVIWTNKND